MKRVRILSCALVLTGVGLVAAGCGDVADDLPTVSGEFGEKPTVVVPDGDPRGLSVTVVKAGDGELVRPGAVADVNYSAVAWPTGEELGDTYTQGGPVPLNSVKSTTPGLNEAIAGKRVGSRIMMVLPTPPQDPAQMMPGQESPKAVVAVIDVTGVAYPPVSGTPVAIPAGLPTVTSTPGRAPTVTIPPGPAPDELVVQPVIRGTGPEVKRGDTIIAQYEGLVWQGGREFDSSWGRGSPASFPIGVDQVIPGWDKGLVGQPIGSRVLLVIPPEDGYGTGGNPQAGLSGTDTLVFAVDILGVTKQ